MNEKNKVIQIRDRRIDIKKLGAFSLAKCIGIITNALKDKEIQGSLKILQSQTDPKNINQALDLMEVSRITSHVVDKHLNAFVELLTIATDLTREDIVADGDEAIDLAGIVEIFTTAFEVNELSGVFDKLGEMGNGMWAQGKAARPNQPDESNQRQDSGLNYSCSTPSQKHTGGLGANSTI